MSAAAYVTDLNGSQVFQFGLGAGGLLSALSPASLETGKSPIGVAVSPDGKSVYVADFYIFGGVSQYDVGAGGLLSQKTPKTVAAGTDPEWIAVSPDGKSVYATNHNSKNVSQYDVGPGGSLSAKTPETVSAEGAPAGVAVSPDGTSVYVDNQESNTVSQYNVGAGGLLSPKTPPAVHSGANPAGIAVSPDGKSVYVTDTGGESISQYDVGAGGLLSPKTPPAVPAGPSPDGIAVSPDGKSVYVTNKEVSGTISQFNVGAGGALSAKTPATVPAGEKPLGIALSPDGRSLYTADQHGYVMRFDVGAGGTLSAKTPATVLAGSGPPAEPSGIALAPDQGPTAAFSVAPASAGSASAFDGSASSDPDGTVARYDWEFGDGSRAENAGPKPTHVYASPGSYTVRLTVTDDAGCSTAFVFTGQTAYCNGSAAASTTLAISVSPASSVSVPPPASTLPVLSSVSQSASRWREGNALARITRKRLPLGTKFSFALNEQASVSFVFTQQLGGRKVKGTCVTQTKKNRRRGACKRTVTRGTLSFPGHAGINSIGFQGRISRSKKLKPGSYTLVISATNSAGARSTAKSLSFTIVT
jgi:DNA-binding beta-propeller fold protein YncE